MTTLAKIRVQIKEATKVADANQQNIETIKEEFAQVVKDLTDQPLVNKKGE